MDSCNDRLTQPELEQQWAKIMRRINAPGQFSTQSGIRVTAISHHSCEGELTVTPGSLNPRGIVHGGCLATLMDTVAGVAACTDGRTCVTLNCSVNYLRAAANTEKVYCRTRLIKAGRTVVVMEAILTDDNDREVATGTYTFYLMEPVKELIDRKDTAEK